MSDASSFTATNGDTIRACSPIEYVTRANARERRAKHQVDLRLFVGFLLSRVDVGSDIPNEMLDQIIDEYVASVEPEESFS